MPSSPLPLVDQESPHYGMQRVWMGGRQDVHGHTATDSHSGVTPAMWRTWSRERLSKSGLGTGMTTWDWRGHLGWPNMETDGDMGPDRPSAAARADAPSSP